MAEAARLIPADAKIVAPPSAGGVLEKWAALYCVARRLDDDG